MGQPIVRYVAAALAIGALGTRAASAVEEGPQLALDVSLANTVLPADRTNRTYLKVGLTGFPIETLEQRPAVNVALVIDRSGSMQGPKIDKAKQAAIAAIDRLRPDDIVSVIVYHDGVDVVLPATKLGNKAAARSAIRSITAKGSTALFAGVSKGAAEVRKHFDEYRVNRIILLSDGRANLGADSPSELGELGASLLKEGIAVTTLGLGLDFNEDLMTQLAIQSNGNYFFAESADDLLATFRHEFDDILSVVAQQVLVDVKIGDGIRPLRVLGHEADIHGQHIILQMNQIYAAQERFVLIEVGSLAFPSGTSCEVADVRVEYVNMVNRSVQRLVRSTEVQFADDARQILASRNRDVEEKTALLLANENNRLATRLRDQGKVDAARRLLVQNSIFLSEKASELNSPLLKQQRLLNQAQVRNIELDWNRTRKLMMRDNAAVQQQASGYGGYSVYGGGYGQNVLPLESSDEDESRLIKLPHEPSGGSNAPMERRQRRLRATEPQIP